MPDPEPVAEDVEGWAHPLRGHVRSTDGGEHHVLGETDKGDGQTRVRVLVDETIGPQPCRRPSGRRRS